MLHIQYISQNTYHNGEKVFDKKEKIVCFLCEFFPNGTKKNDLIHNQMVCRYLKEVWNIEFVDDYCVKIDEKVQCMTWLPWNVQLAVQIIYDSQYHIPIVLTQFIPDMESLVWIAKNMDICIYIQESGILERESFQQILNGNHFKDVFENILRNQELFRIFWKGKWYYSLYQFQKALYEYMEKEDKTEQDAFFTGYQYAIQVLNEGIVSKTK